MNRNVTKQARVLVALAAATVAMNAPVWAASPQQSTQAVEPTKKAEPVRNTSAWNLPKRTKLAISGYDPVAYFPEGGGKAKKGSKRFEHTYKGVTYRFKSQANLELFKKAPGRYEPAHGGWCSWAMVSGGTTEPDPRNFIVKNDRLFLFYDGLFANTRTDWQKGDHDDLVEQADREWKKMSREDKRQVKKPAA